MLGRRPKEARNERPARSGAELPPGPRNPALLQSLAWFRDPVPYMERSRRRYGDIFAVRLGALKKAAFISNPEGVSRVLTGDPELLRMGPTNRLFQPVLGSSSLFLLDGAEHKRHRRLLMPGFRKGHVEGLSEMVAELAERDFAKWPVGEPFALHPRMRTLAVGVIVRTLFGDGDEERRRLISSLLPRLLDLIQKPFAVLPTFQREVGGLSPFGQLMSVAREIEAVLYDEIRTCRLDPDIASREDLLSVLARPGPEEPEFMSDREIRDELFTMLIAGHETTGAALAWAFERLVRHPDALTRVRSELARGDGAYLGAAIKEALRQRPPIPITARKLTAPIDVCGFRFPKSWTLMPCIYLLHHEPSVYPDPHEFRPERFLDGGQPPHRWIPFGGGARHCIGSSFALATTRVVLSTVLPLATLRPHSVRPEPIERRNFTLAPGRGATVVLERRDAPLRIAATAPRRPVSEPAKGTAPATLGRL